MHRPTSILLLGPTGSGKTPLGERIEARGLWGRRCHHFDFGANLRAVAESAGSDAAFTVEEIAFVREVIRSGALLEDDRFPLARKILQRFLAARCVRAEDMVVLNGLPRHQGQARDADAIVDVRAVVCLSAAPAVVLRRIQSNAGGDRIGRSDDDMDSVRRKLDVFSARTAPLVEHYRAIGVRIETINVSADMAPNEAWEELDRRAP